MQVLHPGFQYSFFQYSRHGSLGCKFCILGTTFFFGPRGQRRSMHCIAIREAIASVVTQPPMRRCLRAPPYMMHGSKSVGTNCRRLLAQLTIRRSLWASPHKVQSCERSVRHGFTEARQLTFVPKSPHGLPSFFFSRIRETEVLGHSNMSKYGMVTLVVRLLRGMKNICTCVPYLRAECRGLGKQMFVDSVS